MRVYIFAWFLSNWELSDDCLYGGGGAEVPVAEVLLGQIAATSARPMLPLFLTALPSLTPLALLWVAPL